MSEEEKPKLSPKAFRRLFAEYRNERALTALAMLVATVSSFVALLPSLFIRDVVNYIENWCGIGGTVPLVLWPFVVLIVIAALVQALLGFAQTMTRTELGARITNRLRGRMYSAVQRHSITFHKKTTAGDLIARSTRDINSMSKFVSFAAFATADLAIFLCGAIAILFWINPTFALIALSPVPLAIYLTVQFGARLRGMSKEATESYGEVTTVLQENIAGARVVRAFAQEDTEGGKFLDRADGYVRKLIAMIRFWSVRMIASNFIFSLVMPISLVYGAHARMQGLIGSGDILLCFFFMRRLQHQLRFIVRYVEIFQRAAAGADRVFEVLDEDPRIQSMPGAAPLPPSAAGSGARVQCSHVSFGYEDDKPVLHDISFTAEPGQTVGIVGRTGSGKSTLISLIPRFHDPASGVVSINGSDVRDIKLRQLRRSVGIIFQETFLFSASIRENIAYGRPEADFEAIQAAAEGARAHDFIVKFEGGYDTAVGERGVTLSGGQAQRIAIARAVLLDPKVLIMDDATASVDSETERLIRETMRKVAEGRTNFVIAHRISSVAHADYILVLDNGRVAEQGTHAELMAQDGIYRRMCDQQFSGRGHDD